MTPQRARSPAGGFDVLPRHKALAALLAVPLLLVVIVALLMPRSGAPPAPGGALRYAVVIDAGSTGSRVSVFTFETAAGGRLELVNNVYKALKPGLSSYAGEPASGAASLGPLLETAVAAVPVEHRGVTPLTVRATAGLRLLPGEQAGQLLDGAETLASCVHPSHPLTRCCLQPCAARSRRRPSLLPPTRWRCWAARTRAPSSG